jgi:hypothetical protein
MQLVIDFYFLSVCIQVYMFQASSAHHQESLTVHTASSFCVCVRPRHCLVRNLDGHKHRNWRMYVQWGTPDDERLTLEKCRVIHHMSYKTVPRTDTNTETGGCMYSEGLLTMSAWRSKHVELYIIQIENKRLSQLASGLLIGIYEDARTRKH